MPTVTVKLDKQRADRLARWAKRRRVPKSEVIRALIDRAGPIDTGDDLIAWVDAAVGKVLDPTVEHQARGFFGRRGAVVNALHAPRHDAAHGLSRARAQSAAASGSCVERNASTARFFARTAFMRAGP